MASNPISVVGSDLMYGTYKLWHTGNLTPTWEQVQNKPVLFKQLQFKVSPTSGSQNVTTAQFTEWLTTNGYIKAGQFAVLRGRWSYANNDIISDGPNGEKINLAGSVVEIFSVSTYYYTIRITTPTTQNPNNGTSKRVYVYINNGPNYLPGWFSVLTTEQGNAKYLPLSGGSMSGTLIIDANTNPKSCIGNSTRSGGGVSSLEKRTNYFGFIRYGNEKRTHLAFTKCPILFQSWTNKLCSVHCGKRIN